MPETVTLTVPVTKPSQIDVKLDRLVADFSAKLVQVQWLGTNGEVGNASYPTPSPAGSSQPAGAALLNTLNTGNHSVNSLAKKVFQRLQLDGYIGAGNISGTPD